MRPSDTVKERAASVVSKVAVVIFGTRFWLFYVLALGFCVLQNGLSLNPEIGAMRLMSMDIGHNPFIKAPILQWMLSSYLGPALGYLTGMSQSLWFYVLMHLAIFAAFFTLLILLIKLRYGEFAARCVLLIFVLSPAANVLFTWVGSEDLFTVLLSMAIVAFWNNPVVLAVSAFLLGTNHPEQGSVIMLMLTMMFALTRQARETIKFAVVGLTSLTLGILSVQWYFASHEFNIVFTRLDYLRFNGTFAYVRATLSNPFFLLFSLYNVLIVFIAVYLVYFWRKDRLARGFVIYSVLAFITILFTLDQTRVFATLTFPALLLLVLSPTFLKLKGAERHFFESILAITTIAGMLVPRFVVWNGSLYGSAYAYMISVVQVNLGPLLH